MGNPSGLGHLISSPSSLHLRSFLLLAMAAEGNIGSMDQLDANDYHRSPFLVPTPSPQKRGYLKELFGCCQGWMRGDLRTLADCLRHWGCFLFDSVSWPVLSDSRRYNQLAGQGNTAQLADHFLIAGTQ